METRLNASSVRTRTGYAFPHVEQIARSVLARVYTHRHSRGEAAILDEIRDVERCRIPPRAWSRCTRARSLHGAH